jgi:hypothetical protein
LTVSATRSPLRALTFGLAGVSMLAVSGCMGSPTYGTDKTANAQLFEDLSGAFSLGMPGSKEQNRINYKPRPDLVKPETTAVLPPPQDDVTASTASGWPESPEQRLARIRQEATENRDNPAYRSPVVNDVVAVVPEEMTADQQRAEFRRLRRETSGSSSSRRFLSEPPLDYRVPAATAPVGDLGETEDRKTRVAEREARRKRDQDERD